MKKLILNTVVATAVFATVTSYFTTQATAAPSAQETIVAVVSGNSDFSTLVAALTAADLVEALQGTGPFTVFAPNNAAFAKLPAGTVEDLLKPENKDKLAAILKNHVVAGKVMAADVKPGAVPTLGGGRSDGDGFRFPCGEEIVFEPAGGNEAIALAGAGAWHTAFRAIGSEAGSHRHSPWSVASY